ncbi:hypothetical protein WJX82_004537 [Trebouxia sp. C0006]
MIKLVQGPQVPWAVQPSVARLSGYRLQMTVHKCSKLPWQTKGRNLVSLPQADYVKQDPSNLLQQSALVVYARLPEAASVWWWTIAVGSFATLLHLLARLADEPQASSVNGEAATRGHDNQIHRLGRKVGTMAGSLLRATNHKATNDLALWLYIYRDEGLTATSEALLFLAILSNLPVIRVSRSFAYNAANDYIGMNHMMMMLMTCRKKQSVVSSFVSSVLPVALALDQFLWSMHQEKCLSKLLLFCLSGMQMMTQISHLGLLLKLANDISAGMGLDFWATVLGFQHTTFHELLLAVYHYATNPACWRLSAWNGICAIIQHPSVVVTQLRSTGAIWALYYATSAYGGILARIRVGYSTDDVSDRARKAVASSAELKRSTLLQSFASLHMWAFAEKDGRMGHLPPNTEKSTAPNDLPGVPHVMWAQEPVSAKDVLRYVSKDMLWSYVSELVSTCTFFAWPLGCIFSSAKRRSIVFWKAPGWKAKGLLIVDFVIANSQLNQPDLPDIPEVAEGANEDAQDDFEPAEFTTVRHAKGKHIKGLIGRLPAAVVPVKAPDAPLPGPKARKGGVKRAAAGAAVNAAVPAVVTDGDRAEEAIPEKPRPGLKEHTPSRCTMPDSDAGLENLLFLSSNAVKQYNENCGGDACIICWSADRGVISLPCGHQATCKHCVEKLVERDSKDAECPVCCTKMEGYVTKVSAR